MGVSPKTRDGVLRGPWALVIRLLLVIAAGVSAYLLSVSLTGGSVVGCGPGSDCDSVLQSRWAYFLSIPVSVFALLVDGILLLSTFSCGKRSTPAQRRKAWELLLPGALLVLGSALWFTGLQAFVLRHFCRFCLAAHACNSAAAVLLLLRVPIRDSVERPEKDPSLPRSWAVKLGTIAIVLLALLAAGQMTIAPKTFSVKSIASITPPASNASPAVVSVTTNAAPLPATNRPALTSVPGAAAETAVAPAVVPGSEFDVYGGAVKLNLGDVPLLGAPDAPFKMVSLHDYSCKHCAEMHSLVVAVQRAFSSKLAVVSLPMPLDGKCNPLIRRTPRDHTNACAYARLGLAVWRGRHEASPIYDDWFFGQFHRSGQAPSLVEATNYAVNLLGGLPSLEQALRDPWIDRQLGADIAIFGISMTKFRNGSMPQFIIGTNLVSGIVPMAALSNLVGAYAGPPGSR